MCVDVIIDVIRLFGIDIEGTGIPDWVFKLPSRSYGEDVKYQKPEVYLTSFAYSPPSDETAITADDEPQQYNVVRAVKGTYVKKPSKKLYLVLGVFGLLLFQKFGILAAFTAYITHYILHVVTKRIDDSRAQVTFLDPHPKPSVEGNIVDVSGRKQNGIKNS